MRKLFVLALLLLAPASLPPVEAAPTCALKTVGRSIVKGINPVVNVAYGKDSYQFAYATTDKGDKVPVVFRRSSDGCYLSFSDPGGDATTLSRGIPVPVAKALSIALVKKDLKEKGNSRVQQQINAMSIFAPEYAMAIKSVGLKLPSGAKVLPWAESRMQERKVQ